MFPLRCTVRNCEQNLELLEGDGLGCPSGHRFDRGKEGYWSLLQPQDRKSAKPGDCDEAVLARHRWLQRGHMDGLIELMMPWVQRDSGPRTLDLGCGEGSFSKALFVDQSDDFCGVDLSKRAIRLAARAWPEATWIVANADRELPAQENSVHRVVSMFGRRPIKEIRRVLVAQGTCIVAVPGESDLIELREHAQQSGRRRSRWQAIVDEFVPHGFQLVEHQSWQHRVRLDKDGIADAMAMTYRAVRHSQQSRIAELDWIDATLSADLMLMTT